MVDESFVFWRGATERGGGAGLLEFVLRFYGGLFHHICPHRERYRSAAVTK